MAKQTEYNDDFWSQLEDINEAQAYDTPPLFKLKEKGDKARICFPLVNPSTGRIAFKKVRIFNFEDKAKGTWARFLAPEDTESKAYKIAVKYCGEPQQARVTPVLVYSTNTQGRVISGEDYTLIAIKVTPQRLESLKTLQADYNLSEHDISVVCKESKFQNLDFNILPVCGMREGKITLTDKTGKSKTIDIEFETKTIIQEAMQMVKDGIEESVASKWSEQQIINYFEGNDKDDEDYDDEDFEDDEEPAPVKKSSAKSKPAPAEDEGEEPESDDSEDDEDWD